MVCQFEQAPLDSSELAVWPCLDDVVSRNGNRRLVSLAEGRLDSHSNAIIPTAIVAQRRVVLSIFWPAISRPSLCRNSHAVVSHPSNLDRILESGSCRGLVAIAVSNLGQLRDGSQLFNLAVERLIMFIASMVILQ